MNAYEIHVLNNQEDFDRFKNDERISNKDQILLFKQARLKQMIEELIAALEGNPQIIALVIKGKEK